MFGPQKLPARIVAALLIVSLVALPRVSANPQGVQVRQGQVRIDDRPGQLRIHQQSQRAVIDWQSFSIGAGETTRFIQPNSSAAALNRVRGDSASQIEGMLRANGRVYLINPNGILIGPGGRIDVGGFVASTLDTSDAAFERGGSLRFSGNSDAAIINLGSISALDGDVVLMAGSVTNAGTIRAPRGTAALAAGNDILLAESGDERVFVRGSGGAAKANGVTNTGNIEANIAELKAHGGNVYGMAVKNEGRVAATGVTRKGGQIFLSAGGGKVRSTGTLRAKRSDGSGGRVKVDSGTTGKTEIGGTVDTSGTKGGEIVVLGNEIEVFEGTLILNDGETMGGRTFIGGGRRGEDPTLLNAENVTVGNGAFISASSGTTGNGGEVVVFADGSLIFNGSIAARGGAFGGDGGFVELSGKRSVALTRLAGRIDLSAPAGDAGTFLYDPINISILSGNPVGDIGSSPTSLNTLFAGDIADFLTSSGNLVVTTSAPGPDVGDITMEGMANISWNSANNLTFLADNDFILDPGAIIHSMGSGSVSVTAARSIRIGTGSGVITNDGNLTFSANRQAVPTPGDFFGIHNQGSILVTGSGELLLEGRGGDSGLASQHGVFVDGFNGTALVRGGDTGTTRIDGIGGNSSVDFNFGVLVQGINATVETLGSDLEIVGNGGGAGTGSRQSGVAIFFGGTVTSGAGGDVSITGTGGVGTGNSNHGVELASLGVGQSRVSSGGGNVVINGTSGHGSLSRGVVVASDSVITTVANGGDVTLTSAQQIELLEESSVESGGGAIRIGGSAITIDNSSILNSGTGSIDLDAAESAFISNGSMLIVTDGDLTLDANMGTPVNGDFTGITLSDASLLTSGSGDIILKGRGGDGSFSEPEGSDGIRIFDGTTLSSTGTSVDAGSIILEGSGGSGSTSPNHGIRMAGPGTSISSEVGGIRLTGASVGATGGGWGIVFGDGAAIQSTGVGTNAATITLDGTGADGGIDIFGAGTITAAGANIELFGTATTGDSIGLMIDSSTIASNGGRVLLAGLGSGTADAVFSGATDVFVGSASDRVVFESRGGKVRFSGVLASDSLVFYDDTGFSGADFVLDNPNNDTNTLSALGAVANSGVASLFYRDADNVEIVDESASGGITSAGNVTVTTDEGALYVSAGISSGGGDILLKGIEIYVADSIYNSGSGTTTLDAARNLSVDGAGLFVEDGDLHLTANSGPDPFADTFTGVHLGGANLQANGTGSIHIQGRGGVEPDSGFLIAGETILPPEMETPAPGDVGVLIENDSLIETLGTGLIEITGQGGDRENRSVGIWITGSGTRLATAGGNLSLTGTGGGSSGGSSGASNRGILVEGALIRAGGGGNLILEGTGGSGNDQNDGVQIGNGAILEVNNGSLSVSGTAGGTLGIGVMVTDDAGDIRVFGAGSMNSLMITGTGSNAPGVSLGNPMSVLGSANAIGTNIELRSQGGDLLVNRPVSTGGSVLLAGPANLRVNAAVNGGASGVDLDATNVTLQSQVTSTGGEVKLRFGQNATSGTAVVNILPGGTTTAYQGRGPGDSLDFSGLSTPAQIALGQLDAVEFVIGNGLPASSVHGLPTGNTFTIDAPGMFSSAGSKFTGFANIMGHAGDDVFVFTGNGSIAGGIAGGSGINRIDYSGHGTGTVVDLASGAATGLGGGFLEIGEIVGSSFGDTAFGPNAPTTFQFSGTDSFRTIEVVLSSFENLNAGPFADRFVMMPGSSLSGILDGGGMAGSPYDTLDFSLYGSEVEVNLGSLPLASATGLPAGFRNVENYVGSAASDRFIGRNLATIYRLTGTDAFETLSVRAAGFENLSGGTAPDAFLMAPGAFLSGNLEGGSGPGIDAITYGLFDRPATVNIGPNTATGLGTFSGIERIRGSRFNDRFIYLNQATIGEVDGGPGIDTVLIDDRDLSGSHVYNITPGGVSRNPSYPISNVETLRLLLGDGGNTINSGFYRFGQVLAGGAGSDELNLPGVTSLDGSNRIGNVQHSGFESPRPLDTGDILKQEVDGNDNDQGTGDGDQIDNRNNLFDPALLSSQIGAIGGAFSAAIVAQSVVVAIDGNSYLVFHPISLDGSGISPSNLAINALQQSLGVDANLELAAAIGYGGPIFLFNPDGPYALDLSGAPVDAALLAELQGHFSLEAITELSQALGLAVSIAINLNDGVVSISLDGGVPGQQVNLVLAAQLDAASLAELNAALGL